ncbi:MAG: hypothetical protein VW456_09555, partial [Alphaproteobacteria bacterium]
FDMDKRDVISLFQDITSPTDIAVDFGIAAPCVEIHRLPFCCRFQAIKMRRLRWVSQKKAKQ